jgi:signal transduction histidine kinase
VSRRSAGGAPGQPSESSAIELIATVSHEIRSPLTTIKGFTKTLLDRWERLNDDIKLEMLRAINDDADRVTRILTELLDVSRLEAGKLTLHLQPVDVRELAGEVIDVLGERSDKHKVVLAPGDDVEVRGDPDKLRQVLTNFIENAQKYTAGGTITVVCRGEEGWGIVAVADEGPGVPQDVLGTVFEKFARRDLPGSPTGTGLGLYICRGLIEAHGGDIGLFLANGGSTFWFSVGLADT